jgi:hypothetical protein
MTIDIVKQLKEQITEMQEELDSITHSSCCQCKMCSAIRKYEEEEDEVVWDMTDIDKDWDEIFQS